MGRPGATIAIIVVAVLLFGALIWWRHSQTVAPVAPLPEQPTTPSTQVQPPIPEPAPEVETERDVEAPLPTLDEADATVRTEVLAALGASEVSPTPSPLATWLGQDDLVRRFAALANNAAKGQYPWRQLGFLAPAERLPVIVKDDRIELDPNGYARFDTFVDTVVSVPPTAAAGLVRRYSPLIAEALGELGEGKQDPLATVRAGIDQALATPVIERPIELTQPKVFYEYADPEIESLAPLQKQLVRMGPENVKRLKTYLAEVKAAL
jgi:hypothetical protein